MGDRRELKAGLLQLSPVACKRWSCHLKYVFGHVFVSAKGKVLAHTRVFVTSLFVEFQKTKSSDACDGVSPLQIHIRQEVDDNTVKATTPERV